MLDVAVIRRSGIVVPSMDRFADAIASSTIDPHLRMRIAGADSGLAPRMRRKFPRHWRRWVGQPVALRHMTSDVYHLVDHSDTHLLRMLPARRTVVTCHDLLLLRAAAGDFPYEGHQWWTTRFRWTMSHLSRAGAVACDSRATRADVLRFCDIDPGRIRVIPLGVGGHFRPAETEARDLARRDLGLGQRQAILHVSSGGFYKNSQATLQILEALVRQGSDALLIRAGSAMSASEVKLADRLGISDRVIQKGRISEAELVDLYAAADVFLFPSLGEGFGWPVLEAMACGLPVVVSSADALIELTGPAGRHAHHDDIAGLSEQVAAILENPDEATRLRQLGLARARGYSWAKTHAAYAQVYRELAGR